MSTTYSIIDESQAWEELAEINMLDFKTKQHGAIVIVAPTHLAFEEHFVEAYKHLDMNGFKVILHVDASTTMIVISIRE